MFLNLKNKRVETIAQQQIKGVHPKTYRDEARERNSREHKEVKSHRQPHNIGSKKQTGSTAFSTIQPSHASFTNMNAQFKIKIKDSSDRDPAEVLNSSQEKLDSYRLARVTSAYRKIKRFDHNEGSYMVEDLQKSQERVKRTVKPQKVVKKEALNSMMHNYICMTEADDSESKVMEKINSGRSEIMQELLDPFLELFAHARTERFKERSYSHRDLEIKRSTDKDSRLLSRERKKQSNDILIKDDDKPASAREHETVETFITNFYDRLEKAREKVDIMGNSKKYKYVESPSLSLFQRLYEDIELFVQNFYELCLKQMDQQLKKCEKSVAQLAAEEQKARQRQ
jgi:hypothetical protein